MIEIFVGCISVNIQEFDGNVCYVVFGCFNGELVYVNEVVMVCGQLFWVLKLVGGLSWNLIVECMDIDMCDNFVQWVFGFFGSFEFEVWDFFGNEGYQVLQFFEYELMCFVIEVNYIFFDCFIFVGFVIYEDMI